MEHERREVFYATTILLVAYVATPAACVSCTGQAASRGFDTGECNGIWQERIRKAPAVPRRASGCVVAKNPPCALVNDSTVNFGESIEIK